MGAQRPAVLMTAPAPCVSYTGALPRGRASSWPARGALGGTAIWQTATLSMGACFWEFEERFLRTLQVPAARDRSPHLHDSTLLQTVTHHSGREYAHRLGALYPFRLVVSRILWKSR